MLTVYLDRVHEWTATSIERMRALAGIAAAHMHLTSALERAHRENEQLEAALVSRIVVERAKTVVAVTTGVDLDTAFAQLRRSARDQRMTLQEVAQRVARERVVVPSIVDQLHRVGYLLSFLVEESGWIGERSRDAVHELDHLIADVRAAEPGIPVRPRSSIAVP